jgi:hypothetical protein
MEQLIDHLWQSIVVVVLLAALQWLSRGESAALHVWMWRIAAIKFVLPFTLLYRVGECLGFPVRHNAIPPPDSLLDAVAAAMPWAAPAQTLSPSTKLLSVGLVAGLTGGLACFWLIRRRLHAALREREEQQQKAAADWSMAPRSPGFWRTATLAFITMGMIAAPVLSGALQDRLRRQQALRADVAGLRSASLTFTPVPSEFGGRTEIVAHDTGVAIYHVNLQDLVALVYGIEQFEVFGGALPWLEYPHYDVRVTGPVFAPAVFDAYALREPVTRYLNQQFGVSIRVNGDCQDPCFDQESFVIERIPWTLSKMISGRR